MAAPPSKKGSSPKSVPESASGPSAKSLQSPTQASSSPAKIDALDGYDYRKVLFNVGIATDARGTKEGAGRTSVENIRASLVSKCSQPHLGSPLTFVSCEANGEALKKEALKKKIGLVYQMAITNFVYSGDKIQCRFQHHMCMMSKMGWKTLFQGLAEPEPIASFMSWNEIQDVVFRQNPAEKPLLKAMFPIKAAPPKVKDGKAEISLKIQNRFPFRIDCALLYIERIDEKRSRRTDSDYKAACVPFEPGEVKTVTLTTDAKGLVDIWAQPLVLKP